MEGGRTSGGKRVGMRGRLWEREGRKREGGRESERAKERGRVREGER
jgi:hypothetical protein